MHGLLATRSDRFSFSPQLYHRPASDLREVPSALRASPHSSLSPYHSSTYTALPQSTASLTSVFTRCLIPVPYEIWAAKPLLKMTCEHLNHKGAFSKSAQWQMDGCPFPMSKRPAPSSCNGIFLCATAKTKICLKSHQTHWEPTVSVSYSWLAGIFGQEAAFQTTSFYVPTLYNCTSDTVLTHQ